MRLGHDARRITKVCATGWTSEPSVTSPSCVAQDDGRLLPCPIGLAAQASDGCPCWVSRSRSHTRTARTQATFTPRADVFVPAHRRRPRSTQSRAREDRPTVCGVHHAHVRFALVGCKRSRNENMFFLFVDEGCALHRLCCVQSRTCHRGKQAEHVGLGAPIIRLAGLHREARAFKIRNELRQFGPARSCNRKRGLLPASRCWARSPLARSALCAFGVVAVGATTPDTHCEHQAEERAMHVGFHARIFSKRFARRLMGAFLGIDQKGLMRARHQRAPAGRGSQRQVVSMDHSRPRRPRHRTRCTIGHPAFGSSWFPK